MNKIALITGIIILVLDQLTKMLALKFVTAPVAVVPFFNFVLVWNRGISFGMLSGSASYMPLILSFFSLVIIGFLVVWLRKIEDKKLAIAVCAIIAGALGNVIDRLRFGAVVDFLDFHAFGWHYPAFNIADSAIVLGIAFILFDSIFLEAKRKGSDSHA